MTEILLLLAAAVLHETGHVLCAAWFGIPFSGLSLRPCGAALRFNFSQTTYFRELCVHLAGGAAGLLSAVLALFFFGKAAVCFVGISLCLTWLNLLPIEGFDGGGALYCLLVLLGPPERAYGICRVVSLAAVLLLWTAVLWVELRVRANAALLLFVVYLLIFQSYGRNF
ncbi:MAG: site-2 protease family protein [Eubacteriales bacterium]